MKTITIIGVGALGSHAALFLRNVGQLKLIDFDRVEQKNLLSQFHSSPSIGKAKTLGLQQTLLFLFGTKLKAVTHKLTADNTTELLGGADLLIDCVDNGDTRRLIQAFARQTGCACLHGALSGDGSFGRVIWDEQFQVDDAQSGAPTCEDGAHLPFIALVSAYVARAAQEFLNSGRKLNFAVHSASGASLIY